MLPREHRLRSSREIREVVSRGKRLSNNLATIHFRPAEQNSFAIVVSKSVGNAVMRNLVKRRMRSILSQETNISPAITAVLRMRPAAASTPFAELNSQIKDLIGRSR